MVKNSKSIFEEFDEQKQKAISVYKKEVDSSRQWDNVIKEKRQIEAKDKKWKENYESFDLSSSLEKTFDKIGLKSTLPNIPIQQRNLSAQPYIKKQNFYEKKIKEETLQKEIRKASKLKKHFGAL